MNGQVAAKLGLAEHAPPRHQPRIPHEEKQQRRDDDARNRHLCAHDVAAVRSRYSRLMTRRGVLR